MRFRLCAAAAIAMISTPAFADTDVTGQISYLLSYQGHTGLLIRLSGTMPNPDSCTSAARYIFPDSSARAQLVQSLLLANYSTARSTTVTVSGCYEGFPKIVHVATP